MFPRWSRLGIRPQLAIIVVLGAILSTVATLFIADTAISSYVHDQANAQQQENMRIARVVLDNQYGTSVSIAADGSMVADLPSANGNFQLNTNNNYGKYSINANTDFVDNVQQLIGGAHSAVSVYQCADAQGSPTPCVRIETTIRRQTGQGEEAPRATGEQLSSTILDADHMNATGDGSHTREWVGRDTIDGVDYVGDYSPIFAPNGKWIGVLYVGVAWDTYSTLVTRTTVYLVLIGVVTVIAGIILALIVSNTVITTLQRAARQVSAASERIGGIAAQQANGSAQQVWAINAINQALQNFSETARDISQRTDQLALMGNQVLQRRQEISPTQIDSILAYITRSVRDISVATRQQAAQYERMTGAMQAVIEIAEQVAGNSQQATESSERLDLVVRQLQQVVGVRLAKRRAAQDPFGLDGAGDATAQNNPTSPTTGANRGTIRAVRPSARNSSQALGTNGAMRGMAGSGAMSGAMTGSPNGAGVPAMAGAARGAGQGGAFGGMPVAGGGRMMAMNGMPPSGQMPLGRAPQFEGGMAGGAAMGGMSGGQAGMGDDPFDYRLPPMPEMPPLPDWGGPMPSGGARQERGMARPAPRGMGGNGGMSGPNSIPYGQDNSGDRW